MLIEVHIVEVVRASIDKHDLATRPTPDAW
jgi:hypothetical protein